MTYIIIVAIIAVIVAFAAVKGMKHMKGEGGCCGGGTYKAKKKKLDKVIAKKTFLIEGMSCQHCENRIHEAINDLGNTSAVVSHKRGTAVVEMSENVPASAIIAAVEKAGYKVTGVK